MTQTAVVERQDNAPFVSDPTEVVQSWMIHAKGAEARAATYREWAAASVTKIERDKWAAEAERAANHAAFAWAKYDEWLETYNG